MPVTVPEDWGRREQIGWLRWFGRQKRVRASTGRKSRAVAAVEEIVARYEDETGRLTGSSLGAAAWGVKRLIKGAD